MFVQRRPADIQPENLLNSRRVKSHIVTIEDLTIHHLGHRQVETEDPPRLRHSLLNHWSSIRSTSLLVVTLAKAAYWQGKASSAPSDKQYSLQAAQQNRSLA